MNTLYITGAGVSAESGIPTFRGEDGFWTIGSNNYTPQEMATRRMYQQQPEQFLRWYYHRFVDYRHHGPNAVHYWLADKNLITQNVDGLDGKAGNRDYIPLKVNAAGVMPIIFAQAIMFLPATIVQFFAGNNADLQANTFLNSLNDFTSVPYNIIYFFLVVLFTYVYTALLVNPQQYAEYLKRQNAFIPGIKPGTKTADFIDIVTTRVTLPGSIFLGFISILPAVAAAFGVNIGFAMFFGGTSLLILVAVVLDTLQQIESHLLMRRYDGLTKSGRLKKKGMMTIGAGM